MAGKYGKVVYEIITDSRVAWGMLQDSSQHRVVERVRGRVAELNLSGCEIEIVWAERENEGIKEADQLAGSARQIGGVQEGLEACDL